MATTENLHNGTGSQDTFAFTFPYLKDTDIKVSVGGTLKTVTTHYTLHTPTTIKFTSGNIPASGTSNVRIYRETADTALQATFYPGSAIRSNDLNDNFTQNLYVVQENNNRVDKAWQEDEETIISTETWYTTDDTKIATTKAIEGRIDTKIDSALVDDIAAGSSIDITDNSPSSGKVTIGVIAATGSNSGSMSAADKNKLDGIESNATADQTDAEIRAAVEAASDSNVFTDADHSKLNAIEASATADQTASEIRTLVESATDSNVFTDADHSKLNAIEASATADQTASEIKTLLQSDKLTDSEIATGTLDNRYYTETELNAGQLNNQYYTETELDAGQLDNRYYTETELNAGQLDNRYFTETELTGGALDGRYFTETESDARYFNISSGDTIKDGDTFPDNDTTIATTAAINDRIIDLVDDVGGFVPIANETSFPNANPDVNNGAGTLVSIKALSSNLTSDGSGVATISNGTVGNSTVTINGLANSTTYAATFGMIVETTTTLNTYTFHRLVPKATEVTTVAGNISNINAVANNASNINSAVSNASNINSAVSNASNINSAVSNASNINTVAGNNTNINTVAGIDSDITTVAGVSSNVTTVAGISSDVTSVAGNSTNINAVNSNATNINTVAGAATNINTTAGSIANVNTVATNISNVNDFSDKYRVASSAPTSGLDTGDLYFDTTGNELKVYNGSAWQGGVTATGNLLSKSGDQMTGNLTFSGSQTVDGRDVSVDGAKLDTIDSNANNYTHPNHSGEVTSTADGATVVADNIIDEANLKVSNSPTNGQFLSAQSGNTGGLTWATVDLTNLSANNLTSGTVPDARFPATLPTASGTNLTSLNASNISSGTISASRIPTLNQNTTGTSGGFTAGSASNLNTGTIPDARFPGTLPAINGSNLTNITIPSSISGDKTFTGSVTTEKQFVADIPSSQGSITTGLFNRGTGAHELKFRQGGSDCAKISISDSSAGDISLHNLVNNKYLTVSSLIGGGLYFYDGTGAQDVLHENNIGSGGKLANKNVYVNEIHGDGSNLTNLPSSSARDFTPTNTIGATKPAVAIDSSGNATEVIVEPDTVFKNDQTQNSVAWLNNQNTTPNYGGSTNTAYCTINGIDYIVSVWVDNGNNDYGWYRCGKIDTTVDSSNRTIVWGTAAAFASQSMPRQGLSICALNNTGRFVIEGGYYSGWNSVRYHCATIDTGNLNLTFQTNNGTGDQLGGTTVYTSQRHSPNWALVCKSDNAAVAVIQEGYYTRPRIGMIIHSSSTHRTSSFESLTADMRPEGPFTLAIESTGTGSKGVFLCYRANSGSDMYAKHILTPTDANISYNGISQTWTSGSTNTGLGWYGTECGINSGRIPGQNSYWVSLVKPSAAPWTNQVQVLTYDYGGTTITYRHLTYPSISGSGLQLNNRLYGFWDYNASKLILHWNRNDSNVKKLETSYGTPGVFGTGFSFSTPVIHDSLHDYGMVSGVAAWGVSRTFDRQPPLQLSNNPGIYLTSGAVDSNYGRIYMEFLSVSPKQINNDTFVGFATAASGGGSVNVALPGSTITSPLNGVTLTTGKTHYLDMNAGQTAPTLTTTETSTGRAVGVALSASVLLIQ